MRLSASHVVSETKVLTAAEGLRSITKSRLYLASTESPLQTRLNDMENSPSVAAQICNVAQNQSDPPH